MYKLCTIYVQFMYNLCTTYVQFMYRYVPVQQSQHLYNSVPRPETNVVFAVILGIFYNLRTGVSVHYIDECTKRTVNVQ